MLQWLKSRSTKNPEVKDMFLEHIQNNAAVCSASPAQGHWPVILCFSHCLLETCSGLTKQARLFSAEGSVLVHLLTADEVSTPSVYTNFLEKQDPVVPD